MQSNTYKYQYNSVSFMPTRMKTTPTARCIQTSAALNRFKKWLKSIAPLARRAAIRKTGRVVPIAKTPGKIKPPVEAIARGTVSPKNNQNSVGQKAKDKAAPNM